MKRQPLLSKQVQVLLPLILLGFFLRVWRLPQIPPGLWYDEAYYAMDAAWLLDGGPWQLFFAGNNGREPIFIYLQSLVIWIFGATPLAARLLAPLAGTLTIPLIYVLARRLFRGDQRQPLRWLPYLAAAGLAISFWHIGLSRGGYRGILLPLAVAFLFYAFWQGWQGRSLKWMILAGLALGLSQYTYLAARALPLVFILFALIWSGLHWRDPAVKPLWLTVAITGLVSALIFAPLGWIFYQNPELFSARTGDVLLRPDTPAELLGHLAQAVRLFIDNGDPNWRHHLPGRPMLGWLGWLGFWPGLLFAFLRLRQPTYLFLLTALLILYLPALLSTPPVHALRLSALLPLYYIIFALGLLELAWWLRHRFTAGSRPVASTAWPHWTVMALMMVMLLETGLTVYDYFVRWAGAEDTYVEYNTPLVDFVDYLVELTAQTPVIIPLQLYVHPTTRYLLHDQFVEQPAPDRLAGPVQLVSLPDNFRMLNVANIPELPAFAWLARRPDGQGVVYVSRPPRLAERRYLRQEALTSAPEVYRDRFGRDLAYVRRLADPTPLAAMFTRPEPLRLTQINWADLALLQGYEVSPDLVQPNQPITLNLYWRSLTDLTFDYRLFLQIVDAGGNPISQWEGEAFREDMYRWRPEGILPTQHTLWIGPETPAGPYFIRMGFFDRHTGRRLKINQWANRPVDVEMPSLDQIHLGLFYVSPDGTDPRRPATPLSANFAEAIHLIGVTLQPSPPQNPASKLEVTFHWQAQQPTDRAYTVFLQLLNEQGEIVGGWDSQPFNGLYPTSLWSPGEIVVDTFTLPLPEAGLPPGAYRLISGFYDFETGQRLPVVGGGDFAELGSFTIR